MGDVMVGQKCAASTSVLPRLISSKNVGAIESSQAARKHELRRDARPHGLGVVFVVLYFIHVS